MGNFPEKLKRKLEERVQKGALRELPGQSERIDFVSNDYLGLARHEGTFTAAYELLKKKGLQHNGATGSRLLSGNSLLYSEAEKLLSTYYETEAALIFNSGYDANLGFFSAVPQRSDTVVYDELIHASMRDGIRMGTAKSFRFKHNDLQDLEATLQRVLESKDALDECYIATEAVFSMDGDSPDLEALMALCQKYSCRLVLDEAHTVKGTKDTISLAHPGRDLVAPFARIVTFGKGMGVQGAAILGSPTLKDFLVNFARSFIYTTALPPMTLAAILIAHGPEMAYDINKRGRILEDNINFFNHEVASQGLQNLFIPSTSAIHCCVIKGNTQVKEIAKKLQENGFDVRPILAPTVPEGEERIRFCLHSFNTQKEIKEVLSILAIAIKKLFHAR